MSTHKAAGKAKQHVSPTGKRLGTKVGGMQKVDSGQILVRQNGTKIGAGKNVKVGNDHTLYSIANGTVKFTKRRKLKFDRTTTSFKVANVLINVQKAKPTTVKTKQKATEKKVTKETV